MKKLLLMLLINLLPVMYCSSQSTYPKLTKDSLIVITPQQLKATNLIFLEHKKLSLELPELRLQIASYDDLVKNYIASDTLKTAQIKRLKLHADVSEQIFQSQNVEIDMLHKEKKRAVSWAIGGCTVSVGLLIFLLLK